MASNVGDYSSTVHGGNMGMGKNPGMTWYDPRINGSSSPKIWYDLVNPMPSTIPKIITIFMDDRLSPKGNGIGLWQPGFPFPALIGVGDPHGKPFMGPSQQVGLVPTRYWYYCLTFKDAS